VNKNCNIFILGRGVRTLIKRSKGEFLLHYEGELISAEEGD